MAITATKRLQEIVDLLDQKGYVKAKELSQKYQVSMETIRKDLTFLEEKGVVKKEYGGATLATLGTEKNIEFREKQKYDEKKVRQNMKVFIKNNCKHFQKLYFFNINGT